MIKIRIIGDTTPDLADFARSVCADAVPWSPQNPENQVQYLSIGDIGLSATLRALLTCDRIIYHDKTVWTDANLQNVTENIIYLLVLHDWSGEVVGFSAQSFVLDQNLLYLQDLHADLQQDLLVKKICNHAPDNFLGLVNQRRSWQPQIWVAGCSYAKGGALVDPTQRYGSVLADELETSTTNLAHAGSSIEFAADQIMRSPLRRHDCVIWGITTSRRYSWFTDNQIMHVQYGSVMASDRSAADKEFLVRLLADDARVYLCQRQIQQVRAFCNQIGCRLLMMYHETLDLPQPVLAMKSFLTQCPEFIDINQIMIQRYGSAVDKQHRLDCASDNVHPGPKTHAAWAEILAEHLKVDQ